MTVETLCDLFDGAWSDLPVRFFVDGAEVFYAGGPEERHEPNEGPPDHYELFFTSDAGKTA